jgi:HEAT repeat protein
MSQSHVAPTPNGDLAGVAPQELPPVEPPTAGFILQLFIIPAVIVAVLIVVVALFGKLAEGRRDTSQYVEAIRSDNENVQFRAAYELANLIQNESDLARDPKLLGQLTELLESELGKKAGDPRVARFLAGALGVFQTLDARGARGTSVNPLRALDSALEPGRAIEVRVAATESLARQAARLEGALDDPGVITALAKAAEDPEPELRQRAVFALGFCGGNAARDALRGRVERDEDRFVRYNAASALARRGDLGALDTLREMLSPSDLSVALKARAGHDPELNNRIETVQIEALHALETSIKAKHPQLAQQLRPEIGGLTRSPLAAVRLAAESVVKALPATR